MKPVSPTIPGSGLAETIHGVGQDQYDILPTFSYRDEQGTVLSRWRLTWRERLRVLWSGDVYLFQLTFGRSLQPVMLQAKITVPPVKI